MTNLKINFENNSEFTDSEIAFLSSIGDIFPIYDYITLESISGISKSISEQFVLFCN
ncbi:putative conjugative transfer protein TraH [Orientia tsutsugamushi str. Ikeda]|uniref:Putative conjugative transfer protein TraH n=1 Tax=Orientia tsutsugamushi (strain Ikeda) TaxID=334380 RepID=B3CUM1_ORITI|nr:putative conjugative transfer protein TraH [Orientia tsutsugamushi str. Ikeda]